MTKKSTSCSPPAKPGKPPQAEIPPTQHRHNLRLLSAGDFTAPAEVHDSESAELAEIIRHRVGKAIGKTQVLMQELSSEIKIITQQSKQ